MPTDPIGGTEGYAAVAAAFFGAAERVSFADVHRAVLHRIPSAPADVLDIGAGSGRDAAAFAALGHRVVAVEPVAELRTRAGAAHGSPRIEWLDGSLPELSCLAGRGDRFDLVMLTAVWLHLDGAERVRAMPNVARLIRECGAMVVSLRHGPVPMGRRMFQVSAEETVALASREGLDLTLKLENQASAYARPEVTWTRLAFAKGHGGS